jgi:transposase
MDVRERMLAAYDAKRGTLTEVAQMFGVTRQCIWMLLRQRDATGSIAPRHGGGRTAAYTGATLEQLRKEVSRQPDATLHELRERTGVACSLVAVHNALARLDLRFKKSRCTPASKSGPT